MAAQEKDFNKLFVLMLNPQKESFKNAIKEIPAEKIKSKSNFGLSLLHFAAKNGDLESMKILIEKGADLFYLGGPLNNQTALHYAVRKHPVFAMILIEEINNLNQQNFISELIATLQQLYPKNFIVAGQVTIQQLLIQALQHLFPGRFTAGKPNSMTAQQILIQVLEQIYPGNFIITEPNPVKEQELLIKALETIVLCEFIIEPEPAAVQQSTPIIHPSSPIFSTTQSLNDDNTSDPDDDFPDLSVRYRSLTQ